MVYMYVCIYIYIHGWLEESGFEARRLSGFMLFRSLNLKFWCWLTA